MKIRQPEFLKVKIIYRQIIPSFVVIDEKDTLKEFYKELRKLEKENRRK